MRAVFLHLTILLIAAVTGLASTIHVPGDYPTIQGAIDAAADGDTVLVAPDTYVENLDFLKKTIVVRSSGGPAVTMVNGNEAGYVVWIQSSGTEAVLEGFTLANGWGVSCSGSSPVIRNNIITGNLDAGISCYYAQPLIENNLITQNRGSGGIDCDWGSDPVIRGNTISRNEGVYMKGGAVTCLGTSPLIEGNRFFGNSSDRGGAVFCIDYSYARIDGNIFSGNSATYSGGAVCIENSTPQLVNNVFVGNSARSGGALACSFDSYVLMANCTFFGNSAELEGGAVDVCYAWLDAANSIFWNDSAPSGPGISLYSAHLGISYSDLENGQASVSIGSSSTLDWGAGMVDADPLFVDEAGSDFHIQHDSPCRDAGWNQPPVSSSVDLEGDPRIAYGTADMGADEHHTHLYHMGDTVPGGTVEIKITGLPGTSPMNLYVGSGVLPEPHSTPWGNWYLRPPVKGPVFLGTVPSPGGVAIFTRTIPPALPAPQSLAMQAIVGQELTNLNVLEVQAR